MVTEEEAEQRNSTVVSQPTEDLSGILERPLMAFVQEFRFRPPPVYSEVSLQKCRPYSPKFVYTEYNNRVDEFGNINNRRMKTAILGRMYYKQSL